ncbi:uncharacterized protein LOC134813381 [Bolinopsis microptera]|uniref:uncharacterized protein LOC134813381 n=1 Tax=Bolinopsis microptera TaxID=2820187 RepID=UPI00307AAEC6
MRYFYLIVLMVLMYNEARCDTGWQPTPNKDNPFPYNLDRFPMQIRTTTATQNVWIQGNVDQSSSPVDSYAGILFSLAWQMSDNSIWLAYHNLDYGEEFFNPTPTCSARGGDWTLFKLKRKMVLRCGNEDVYEILYKDLYDSKLEPFLQRSVKALSKTVTNIWFDHEHADNAEYKRADYCYKGYKMAYDGGCDECPENTYNTRLDNTVQPCTSCPDNMISPPGSSSVDDCKEKGYKIPIMAVLVNNQRENHKPGYMFDDNTATYYHHKYNKIPGVKVYFGYEVEVSRVKITNRLDYANYLPNLKSTAVSVMLKDGGVDECGTLGDDNTIEYKTFTVLCGNKRGIGLVVERPSSVNGWCISELEIYHYTGMQDVCEAPTYYNQLTNACESPPACNSGDREVFNINNGACEKCPKKSVFVEGACIKISKLLGWRWGDVFDYYFRLNFSATCLRKAVRTIK